MLGQFLELSVASDNVLESIAFYERLGLRQVTVGDVWTHPYAVMTDGAFCIGLHRYEFEGPALTFVRPDLAMTLAGLRSRGIQPQFAKVAPDEFNEAGFLSPDGQMIALLEARTFSPPACAPFEPLCGHFDAVVLPVRSIEDSEAFWSQLGFREERDAPQRLRGSGVRLELSESADALALAFRLHERDEALAALAAAGVDVRVRDGMPLVRAPEGLRLRFTT